MAFGADGLTIGLVLAAALLHASWNALAKASGDPLVNIAIVTSTGGLMALPVIAWSPWPSVETWRWLAFSAAIHFVYQLGLVRMYRLGDLSQVYPIARGLAPLGVAGLGAFFIGESMAPHQVVGLILAALAIGVLGRSGGAASTTSPAAVRTALVVATLIGLYSYSDGRGVRTVEFELTYIAWSALLGCVPFAVFAIRRRGTAFLPALRADGLRALGGGVMATIGYGIALWAMARAPLALVSSLRESSVLFAAVMGAGLLGESFGRRRIAAAAVLVVGLILVQTVSR